MNSLFDHTWKSEDSAEGDGIAPSYESPLEWSLLTPKVTPKGDTKYYQ